MAPPNFQELSNFIWSVADLLRGPYRPPQYERVMLPMVVLRRFDCVLEATKPKVLAEFEKRKGSYDGDALDKLLMKHAVGPDGKPLGFYNKSPLLVVNANQIDFINSTEHFNALFERVLNMTGVRQYFNPNPELL